MQYTLERRRTSHYPTEKILAELRRVAGLYDNRYFSRCEFDEKATDCKGTVVLDRFGSWQAALQATGLDLEKVKKDRSLISNDQLFEELGRVWQLIGHRPSKDEWEKVKGKYSYTTYKTRFNGWVSACAAFIEYVSTQNERANLQTQTVPSQSGSVTTLEIVPEEKRNIPDGVRYRVLKTNNYKCVLCGRSPATHFGVVLHVDHIVPFSKGGKTVRENLRTLCNECNWGRGDNT